MAALPHLTGMDDEGVLRWAVPVFDPIAQVTAEAVWSAPDDETGERDLITPQIVLPGYWCIISLLAEDAVIKASGACKLVASRDLLEENFPFGYLTHLNWSTEEFSRVLYFEPQILGVNYRAS